MFLGILKALVYVNTGSSWSQLDTLWYTILSPSVMEWSSTLIVHFIRCFEPTLRHRRIGRVIFLWYCMLTEQQSSSQGSFTIHAHVWKTTTTHRHLTACWICSGIMSGASSRKDFFATLRDFVEPNTTPTAQRLKTSFDHH